MPKQTVVLLDLGGPKPSTEVHLDIFCRRLSSRRGGVNKSQFRYLSGPKGQFRYLNGPYLTCVAVSLVPCLAAPTRPRVTTWCADCVLLTGVWPCHVCSLLEYPPPLINLNNDDVGCIAKDVGMGFGQK